MSFWSPFGRTFSAIRAWRKTRRVFGAGEQGIGLVETLVALAIMGTAVTAGLSAFVTGAKSTTVVVEKLDLEILVRSQLEYTKACDFQEGYGTDVYFLSGPTPAGYTLWINAEEVPDTNADIQQITVNGSDGDDTYSLTTFKVMNR